MVRAGGSASRAINDSDAPDPGGCHHPARTRPQDDPHRPRWTPNKHGFPALGSLTPAEEKRRDRAILASDSVVVERNSTMDPTVCSERDEGLRAPLGRNVSAARRGMQPAGISGPAQGVAPVHLSDVKISSAVQPLSAEAVELSPALVLKKKVESGRKTKSSGAGGVAPAVVADLPAPTAAVVTFSLVAEVQVSASVTEDDSSVAQTSEQHIVCGRDSGKVPETSSVTKPMKHSAQKIDLDGTPMEGIVVLEPLTLSVPDVSLDSRPMAGNMNWNPLEHMVPAED